jgi:hypothetical protein
MAHPELSLMEFLQTHRRGELLHEADDALTLLITAIRDIGGAGCITIKLPFKQNKAGQLECTPSVDVKAPRKPLATGIYYASGDGRLTRRDPKQMDIEDMPGVARLGQN